MSMLLERLTKPSPTNEAPDASELRRNDLLVAGVVLFALFLAFGIRNQVLNASKSVQLGENLPRISYPDRWRVHWRSDGLGGSDRITRDLEEVPQNRGREL